MQSTATHHIDNFMEALPQPEQGLALRVRQLLFTQVPAIEECFRYKLPFYDYFGMLCYLHFDKAGLHLCFCRGKDLVAAFPQLELKNRTTIASITLREANDLQRLEVAQLIAAAADWNREASLLKIPMIKRRKTQSERR